jgi:hypothetical protein
MNTIPLDNAKYVGEKILEGGEVVLTSLNDNAKRIKEGGEVVLTSLKSDLNDIAGEFGNEFSAFDIHYQAGETTCQMIWRLWLLIFLAINAVILIGATIFIFFKGKCMSSFCLMLYLPSL